MLRVINQAISIEDQVSSIYSINPCGVLLNSLIGLLIVIGIVTILSDAELINCHSNLEHSKNEINPLNHRNLPLDDGHLRDIDYYEFIGKLDILITEYCNNNSFQLFYNCFSQLLSKLLSVHSKISSQFLYFVIKKILISRRNSFTERDLQELSNILLFKFNISKTMLRDCYSKLHKQYSSQFSKNQKSFLLSEKGKLELIIHRERLAILRHIKYILLKVTAKFKLALETVIYL
ncbi:hypothetical protein HWI79_1523 [Cryptosporidium felis]|nr:hypothetical protein HWI79_1523 [Cryptosporidium felis]